MDYMFLVFQQIVFTFLLSGHLVDQVTENFVDGPFPVTESVLIKTLKQKVHYPIK